LGKKLSLLFLLIFACFLFGCGFSNKAETESGEVMQLYINGEKISVSWEENESVEALRKLVSEEALEIEMSMYGGFEQVGYLGQYLPRNDKRMTTGAGDIVLYSGNQIVIFYGSNTWSYTKLGNIVDMASGSISEIPGKGNVNITIKIEENEKNDLLKNEHKDYWFYHYFDKGVKKQIIKNIQSSIDGLCFLLKRSL